MAPGRSTSPAAAPPPAHATVRSAPFPKPVVYALLGMILVGHIVLGLTAVSRQSVTADEPPHLIQGIASFKNGDFTHNPENGMLPQRLAGAATVLFNKFNWPGPLPDSSPTSREMIWDFNWRFFNNSGNDPQSLVGPGRAAIALVSALSALVVFLIARRAFNDGAALIAAGLFALCPTMLAHGFLITSDAAAGLFFPLASWCVWRLMHRVTPLSVLASGLSAAGLATAKMSGVLLIPIAGALLAVRFASGASLEMGWKRSRLTLFTGRLRCTLLAAGAVAAAAVIAWAGVWGVYDFRYRAASDNPVRYNVPANAAPADSFDANAWQIAMQWAPTIKPRIEWAMRHKLLPESYLYGFGFVIGNAQKRAAYFNGQWGMTGWPEYFPFAVGVKTPVPLLLLTLGSVGAGVVLMRRPEVRRAAYALAPLLVMAGVYWFTAVQAHLNIGHRHMLPTYPLYFILAGGLASALLSLRIGPVRTLGRIAVAALLLWFAAESFLIRPNYLTYFNGVVTRTKGAHKYLVDSNLDWGQALIDLRTYLVARADKSAPVYLAYFGGSIDPARYGIDAVVLPSYPDNRTVIPRTLKPGVYCIGASILVSAYDPARGPWNPVYEDQYQAQRTGAERAYAAAPDLIPRAGNAPMMSFDYWRFRRLCAWLRQTRAPDADAGGAILIYNLTAADLRAALDAPIPMEAAKPTEDR